MTTPQIPNQLRQRLSELLCAQNILIGENLNNFSLTQAAVDEGVDLLLWPDVSDARVDVDLTAVQARQKEYALWHLRMKNALRQVLVSLDAAAIPVMVLRGLSLSTTLYADAKQRPQSDIDLIFKPKHVLQAKQVLWDIGFRVDSVYANIFNRGDIQLDIHVEPLGIERIQSWTYLTPLRAADFFTHAQEGELLGEKALLVHARVNLPYLCFHAMKHSFERLIWLYDIALLSKQIEADGMWDEVLQGIQEYRLERPCFYALSYAQKYLGGTVPDDILDKLCPDMGWAERRLFAKHMNHEIVPYLAERVFARMQPDLRHRLRFWKETIYPRYEIREQMANGGCVKCSFIRKRLKQLLTFFAWPFRQALAILKR